MWLFQEWVSIDTWAPDASTLMSHKEEEACSGVKGRQPTVVLRGFLEAQWGQCWSDSYQLSLKSWARWRQRGHHWVWQDGAMSVTLVEQWGQTPDWSNSKGGQGVRKGRWGVETASYSFKELCWHIKAHMCSCSWNISWTIWNQAVDHMAWKFILESPD